MQEGTIYCTPTLTILAQSRYCKKQHAENVNPMLQRMAAACTTVQFTLFARSPSRRLGCYDMKYKMTVLNEGGLSGPNRSDMKLSSAPTISSMEIGC